MENTDFKAQVREDFAEVLLNTAEFGRTCLWNGHPLQIAEDARRDEQSYAAQGVNKDSKIIYCRDVDLSPPPQITEQVDLDGQKWYVDEVLTPFGYLIIKLLRRMA